MKKILFFTIVIFHFAKIAFPQSQGPNSPAMSSYSAIGCLSCPGGEWNNYNDILVGDGQNAEVELPGYPMCFQTVCFYSRYLIAQNFGFTIPAIAIIDGVTAEITCRSAFGGITDTIVKLISANQPSGNNNSPGSMSWLPTTAVIFYGDTNDLWGIALTPDSVNHPDFGIGIMVRNSSAISDTAYVDHVRLTVYYSLTTGIFSQTRTVNLAREFYYSPAENVFIVNQGGIHNINFIFITDITGKEICTFTPAAGQQRFSLPVLTNGVYFAIVNTSEKVIAKKFAVTN